jgi:hypothetical protein
MSDGESPVEELVKLEIVDIKIQNEYGLFRADEGVRVWRRSKEEQEKEAQLADKPGIPSIYIYADESGKNQQFSMVGSIWIPDVGKHNKLLPPLKPAGVASWETGSFEYMKGDGYAYMDESASCPWRAPAGAKSAELGRLYM